MPSDTRRLAAWLADLGDDALTRVLAAHRVAPDADWNDFFDAADRILDPAVLPRALARLPRAHVEALDAAGDAPVPAGATRDDLAAIALIDDDGAPYPAVREALQATPRVDTPAKTSADLADPESDAAAAERAFSSATALGDLIHLALSAPLGRIGTGALAAGERRRLVDEGAVADADAAEDLVEIAVRTGLLADAGREWRVTVTGRDWLAEPTVTRWHAVAQRLRDGLAPGIRTPDGGWIDVSDWPAAHPLDPEWPARAARRRALLTRWALLHPDGSPTAWSAPLAAGDDADEGSLQSLLPGEVDRVYLQNDLTAIAPGPLHPRDDLRLRTMARRETRAQASTYRFTADTISAAFARGETAESVRAFLTRLSLTGLPQPLAYEIDRAAARHGLLQVVATADGRTRLRSDDDALLRTVAVDQALRPLGFIADDDELASRAAPEAVYWMLADARYPVSAIDARGNAIVPGRERLAQTPDAATADVHAGLIARLRTSHTSGSDAAWLERELEQAARTRSVVEITVRLPDASERVFTLEVTGVAAGRLRGLDRAADVERTLPLSHIVRVHTPD